MTIIPNSETTELQNMPSHKSLDNGVCTCIRFHTILKDNQRKNMDTVSHLAKQMST